MEQKIVAVNMSFETRMGKEDYKKLMEIIDITNHEHIDNKKLIDFFALDKRPFILVEIKEENVRPPKHTISEVEIKLIG